MSLGSVWTFSSQRRTLGALRFGRGDLAVLQHVVDHQVPATQCALRIVDRRICVGSLGKPRQDRRFLQGEVLGLLAEVEVGARLEAVHAVAEINLVGVQSKDLRLGEAPLNLDGQHHFLHLAPEIAVGRKKQVARELHGQRRSALGPAVEQDIAPGRAEHPPDIHAPVLLEFLVLGRDQRIAQHLGEVVVGVNDAALQRKLADHAVLVVIELRDGAGPELF